MFYNILSMRAIQVGVAFFVLVVSGCLLYSWHVRRTTDAELARHDRFTQGLEKPSDARPAQKVNVPTENETPGLVNTPDENTDTPMPDATEALPNETEFADIADAFLPDDVVSEEAPAEDVQVSRFGLGPYPEIPKEWNFIPNYWETVDSIEGELLTRVSIKMHNEGIRSKYASIGMEATGRITALERGSVLVEYDIDENGEKRIYSTLAHPDDLSPGMYTRFSEIPSHLKIVTADEIAFDPYEYLGLSK